MTLHIQTDGTAGVEAYEKISISKITTYPEKDNFFFSGYIDMIFEYNEGIIIVDWKTERQSQGAISTDYFVCAMSKSTFGSCIDPRNLRNRFISSCRILGKERQKHLTIHHGRHSFVSHSLFGGRSLAEVRDAAGHSNISITSVYADIVSDDDGNGNLFDFEIENIKKNSNVYFYGKK